MPTKPKGLPGAPVAGTAEFVSYEDGAVVSREIVRKPAGSVTLFAFDEGQELSEHTAPFGLLAQRTSDRGRSLLISATTAPCHKTLLFQWE